MEKTTESHGRSSNGSKNISVDLSHWLKKGSPGEYSSASYIFDHVNNLNRAFSGYLSNEALSKKQRDDAIWLWESILHIVQTAHIDVENGLDPASLEIDVDRAEDWMLNPKKFLKTLNLLNDVIDSHLSSDFESFNRSLAFDTEIESILSTNRLASNILIKSFEVKFAPTWRITEIYKIQRSKALEKWTKGSSDLNSLREKIDERLENRGFEPLSDSEYQEFLMQLPPNPASH